MRKIEDMRSGLKTSKEGKKREMRDIDEDSDFEDIKKRGKRREMSDIDEDI